MAKRTVRLSNNQKLFSKPGEPAVPDTKPHPGTNEDPITLSKNK
jgi:hypothetical protein